MPLKRSEIIYEGSTQDDRYLTRAAFLLTLDSCPHKDTIPYLVRSSQLPNDWVYSKPVDNNSIWVILPKHVNALYEIRAGRATLKDLYARMQELFVKLEAIAWEGSELMTKLERIKDIQNKPK